ncbi:MAG: hypothetical protein FWC38_05650, partial [Proteobacteria bacterium]|nr:hypothetical protein [Pseudomonadota bacterium]MCL2307699.1 hypothetical protein [Pseudomonadota bacterium]
MNTLKNRILQAILNATCLRGRELFAAQLAAHITAQMNARFGTQIASPTEPLAIFRRGGNLPPD